MIIKIFIASYAIFVAYYRRFLGSRFQMPPLRANEGTIRVTRPMCLGQVPPGYIRLAKHIPTRGTGLPFVYI